MFRDKLTVTKLVLDVDESAFGQGVSEVSELLSPHNTAMPLRA